MGSRIIFTLTGTDRVGVVEEVTHVFVTLGGNVGTSRMARLGGEFVMLMEVALPTDDLGKPIQGNQNPNLACRYNAYKFDTSKEGAPRTKPDWAPYLELTLGYRRQSWDKFISDRYWDRELAE